MPLRFVKLFAVALSAELPAWVLLPPAYAQPLTLFADDTAPYDSVSQNRPAATAPLPYPEPPTTFILQPGHWALRGPRYVWVPPETWPHPVQFAPVVPGAYVWRNGEYVWVSAYFAK